MTDLTQSPKTDPTQVYRYRDALFSEEMLIVGLVSLDLFSWLAENPNDLAGIAAHYGFASRPTDVMITLFRAMGLLERVDAHYQPTLLAREHFVASSPWFLGPYYASLKDRPVAADLLRVLKSDRPANWGSQANQLDWHRAMERPEFAEQFTAAMDCRGVFLAQALAKNLPIQGARSLLDIAGGSGVYACSLCAHFPDLHATVLEKSPVDQIARSAIAKRGMTERVSVTVGDMLTEALPKGHDLHLFSNVLHDWDVPVVKALLQSSFDALVSGGQILIHDAFLNREKDGPLHVAEYSVLLMHATQGRCYGLGELEAWLEEVGFRQPQSVEGGAARGGLLARKP